MATPEVAGIGALLKPNKYSILKFVDLHPGGAAALSGQVCALRMCPGACVCLCVSVLCALGACEGATAP